MRTLIKNIVNLRFLSCLSIRSEWVYAFDMPMAHTGMHFLINLTFRSFGICIWPLTTICICTQFPVNFKNQRFHWPIKSFQKNWRWQQKFCWIKRSKMQFLTPSNTWNTIQCINHSVWIYSNWNQIFICGHHPHLNGKSILHVRMVCKLMFEHWTTTLRCFNVVYGPMQTQT